jgi:hypothetical protein
MKKPLVAYPLKKQPKFEYVINAFDTETDGLGGELLCITFACLNEKGQLMDSGVFSGPEMVERFFDFVIEKGAGNIWYAHNAQYDFRYLFPHIEKYADDLHPQIRLRAQNSVYQIGLSLKKDGEELQDAILLRDSMAFYPGTLKDLSEKFSPEASKLSGAIDFEKEKFDIKNVIHQNYAIRDSEALALSMYNLNEEIKKLYGVPMGATTAGTALKAWRRTIKKEFYTHAPTIDFCRSAYYGGIVFLTTTNPVKDCVTIDVNSCYPYVMRRYGIPYGTPAITRAWHGSEVPAIYKVRITAPDNLRVPIIPCRIKGSTRWPRGRFETVCTNAELEFALSHGYSKLEILDGLLFERFDYPFTDFVNKSEKIRRSFSGRPEETLAKLIQNSLYGKFGTKQIRQEVFIPSCDAECENAEPIDEGQIFWVRYREDAEVYCNPAWAAFITAHARLHLLRTVYDVIGVDHCYYGDTDSITAKAGPWMDAVDIGGDYGQFKVEKQWAVFRPLAPKVYAGQLQDGAWGGRVKGIPRKKARGRYQELFENGQILSEYESLDSFWVGMRRGFTPAAERHRISTDIKNSGSWQAQADGSILPRFVDQVLGD